MDDKQKKILIAVDGSENSKRVLIEAKKLASQPNVEITLLTVVKPVISAYYDNIESPRFNDPEEMRKAGRAVLDWALQVLGKSADEVVAKVRRGDPADEILNEVEQEKYDLVVMGSRGLGTFTRTLLGSVSNKVLNHVDSDVLIIR